MIILFGAIWAGSSWLRRLRQMLLGQLVFALFVKLIEILMVNFQDWFFAVHLRATLLRISERFATWNWDSNVWLDQELFCILRNFRLFDGHQFTFEVKCHSFLFLTFIRTLLRPMIDVTTRCLASTDCSRSFIVVWVPEQAQHIVTFEVFVGVQERLLLRNLLRIMLEFYQFVQFILHRFPFFFPLNLLLLFQRI